MGPAGSAIARRRAVPARPLTRHVCAEPAAVRMQAPQPERDAAVRRHLGQPQRPAGSCRPHQRAKSPPPRQISTGFAKFRTRRSRRCCCVRFRQGFVL